MKLWKENQSHLQLKPFEANSKVLQFCLFHHFTSMNLNCFYVSQCKLSLVFQVCIFGNYSFKLAGITLLYNMPPLAILTPQSLGFHTASLLATSERSLLGVLLYVTSKCWSSLGPYLGPFSFSFFPTLSPYIYSTSP